MNETHHRIGLIVPSSNTTIETEMPEMLARRARATGERFTFHSSRALLHSVDEESLARMVGELDRCANELIDARTDVILYACLVALMVQGAGAHEKAERRIGEILTSRGHNAVVSSSAGALVRAVEALGIERVAIITPYVEALTAAVADYLEAAGVTVVRRLSLVVQDNVEVGKLDQEQLLEYALDLDLADAEALIISACVQMPSLDVIAKAEDSLGLPVLSAATAGVFDVLSRLGLDPAVPNAGSLLAGGAVRVETT
jgi:maleate isomerase